MNKKLSMLFPVTAILLSGCVGNVHYNSSEYVKDVVWERDTFKVLTLGDIHFSITDNYQQHFEVMQRTIDASNPDLIVLNGDAFTFASKETVRTLFDWLDSRKNVDKKPIKWTFTFGNHDDQGQYADTWIPREMSSARYKNCACPDLKKLENDDVTGRTNFVLNLKKDGDLKYQIYVFDSNSYNFQKFEGEYKNLGEDYYYDSIKIDQIEWYKRMINDTANGVKSSAFFHIPVPEFNYLFNRPEDGSEWTLKDEYREKDSDGNFIGDGAEALVSSPQNNTGLFEAMKESQLTQSVTCSHDHVNNFVCNYEGIYLTYGTHATNRIYYAKDKIGGQVMTIKQDQSISFENIFVENDYPEAQLL